MTLSLDALKSMVRAAMTEPVAVRFYVAPADWDRLVAANLVVSDGQHRATRLCGTPATMNPYTNQSLIEMSDGTWRAVKESSDAAE